MSELCGFAVLLLHLIFREHREDLSVGDEERVVEFTDFCVDIRDSGVSVSVSRES